MDRVQHVDDPGDPRIAAYRDVRERDLVGRQGLFVAEGEVVLRVLTASPLMDCVSVLLAEKRVEGLADALERLPPEVPIYAAGQAVMDAIVGFPIHRGVLALGRRRATPSAGELLAGLPGGRTTVLALNGIANHDNMGGLFRNAAAFGADAVLIDAECCDPLYRKAIRVSVGASLRVRFARLERGEDVVGLLGAAGFEALALSPRGGTSLDTLERPERAAVLLGAEGPGLPEAMMARCRTVSIPMAAGFDSLNVAVTGGIVLWALG